VRRTVGRPSFRGRPGFRRKGRRISGAPHPRPGAGMRVPDAPEAGVPAGPSAGPASRRQRRRATSTMIPAGLKYTREHVWVRVEKNAVTLGITDHAQEQLGDVLFVDLPDLERKVKAGEGIVILETVGKTTGVNCPVTGTVTAVNEELVQHPEKVNESPYEEGWILKLKVGNPDLSKLLDAAGYESFVTKKP
jgi:glycine cleavage system H protein